MKMKYFLACLVLGLASVLSFANETQMSYYTISPEKVEKYAEQDLLKDTAKVFDLIENQTTYTKWYCGHFHTDKVVDKINFMFNDFKSFE